MRKAVMLMASLVVTSRCASVQPYKAVGTTNKDATEVFNCALGVATSLDYAPEQGRNRRLIESSHEVVEAANKIVSACK